MRHTNWCIKRFKEHENSSETELKKTQNSNDDLYQAVMAEWLRRQTWIEFYQNRTTKLSVGIFPHRFKSCSLRIFFCIFLLVFRLVICLDSKLSFMMQKEYFISYLMFVNSPKSARWCCMVWKNQVADQINWISFSDQSSYWF